MDNNFDPDAYLSEKSSSGGFNPDSYLAEKQGSPKAKGFMQGLTTNLPTEGIGATIGRSAPATIGGMIGATAGAGWASVPGAAAGGAAGEGVRQALVSASDPSQQRNLGDVTGDVVMQGAGQGLSQATGVGIGKLATRAIPVVAKGLQAINATPSKYGEALLEAGASGIARGKKLAGNLIDKSYQAFENYTGMTGLRPLLTQGAKYLDGKIVPASSEGGVSLAKAGSDFVQDVALRASSGESVDQQTLYAASQMANNLRTTNPFAPESEKLMAGSMTKWKGMIEDALEKKLPEYSNLRADRFSAAAGERASSFFPLNKDTSVNALRSYGAMQAGLGSAGAILGAGRERSLSGAEKGAAIGVGIGALATSPKIAFGAIQGGSRLLQSGIPQATAGSMISAMTSRLQELYERNKNGANP